MRSKVSYAAAILALAGCSSIPLPGASPQLVVREGAKQRSVTFTYVAKVKEAPAGAKRLDLWLPMPQSTPEQLVKDSRIQGPVPPDIRVEGGSGNKMAHFLLEGDKLKPCEITAEYDVDIVERIGDLKGSMFADEPHPRDLLGDKLAPIGGPTAQMAADATKDATGTVDAADKIYRKVLEKMRYSKEGEGWGKGSTEFACASGYGNCTDFHAMFMSMARSKGIPTRFTIGFPLPEARGEGEVKGYHCWAEFYVKNTGWVPVDASEADKALDAGKKDVADYYFGNLTENRIAFTRGRDIDLEPRQTGEHLNFFIYPYAELDGKPFTALDKAFRFKDR